MSKDPPYLIGYNFSTNSAHQARLNGKLLSIRTELGKACNYNCIYCNENGGESQTNNILPYEKVKDVIKQVKDLGAQSVVVIGGGEPTLYPHFQEVIEFIRSLNMIPVVFTNGSRINNDLAVFLYENNASILLKMDSQREDIQNRLAGCKDAYRNIQRAIECFIAVGYNKNRGDNLRLGISFVSTKLNHEEIPALWRFCRKSSFYPNHELLILRGRATHNSAILQPSFEATRDLKKELHRIDSELGYDWLPYKPLTSAGCLQIYYSVYVATDGYIRPCADIDIKLFNIWKDNISTVLQSKFFKMIRNFPEHIEGKCGCCPWNSECIGCRGAAYALNIDRLKNPYHAILCEDPFCWRPS